ncbi:hypothetical protein [Thiohalobacter thiocyanaticus]|nr:hypothetical protein [Thiohalobacter thiocyanaticus]
MPGAGEGMPTGFFVFGPIMWIIFALIIIVPFWAIFSKAGYSKWLSLLMVIPIVNLIALYFLAFSAWPSLRKRD